MSALIGITYLGFVSSAISLKSHWDSKAMIAENKDIKHAVFWSSGP